MSLESNIFKKSNIIYIFGLAIFLLTLSVINNEFVVNLLFFCCYLLCAFLNKNEKIYDNIYTTFLISLFFDYTICLPKYNKIYLYHIMLVIFLIYTAVYFIRNKKFKIDKISCAFFSGMFIYMLISYFWSADKMLNLKYIVIYSIMFSTILLLILYNNTYKRIKKSLIICGVIFVFTILEGVFELFTAIQLPVKHSYDGLISSISYEVLLLYRRRPVSLFYNSNNFATYLNLFIPIFFIGLFYAKKVKEKVLYYIIIALSIMVLIFTTSRLNIFGMVFMLIIFTIIILKSKQYKKIIYPISILIFMFLISKYSYVINNNSSFISKIDKTKRIYSEMIKSPNNKANEDDDLEIGKSGSENERYTIAYDIFKGIIYNKRIFGFGAGNTERYLRTVNNTNGIFSPHGLFFEILGDFGPIVLIIYLLYYFYLIFKSIVLSRSHYKKIALFSIISLLGFIFGSFSPSSVTYYPSYWIVLALTISLITNEKYNDKKQEVI